MKRPTVRFPFECVAKEKTPLCDPHGPGSYCGCEFAADCADCMLQIAVIFGGSIACVSHVLAAQICWGGPITAPACVVAIAKAVAACGATVLQFNDYLDGCFAAMAVG